MIVLRTPVRELCGFDRADLEAKFGYDSSPPARPDPGSFLVPLSIVDTHRKMQSFLFAGTAPPARIGFRERSQLA